VVLQPGKSEWTLYMPSATFVIDKGVTFKKAKAKTGQDIILMCWYILPHQVKSFY
jgi:hypothetical protein